MRCLSYMTSRNTGSQGGPDPWDPPIQEAEGQPKSQPERLGLDMEMSEGEWKDRVDALQEDDGVVRGGGDQG